MAERRKVRSGTGRPASTRSRAAEEEPVDELLDGEPEDIDDETLDADEPGEIDDGMLDADEPEDIEDIEDKTLDADEPEASDEEPPGNGRRRPARRVRSAMTAGEAAKAALREIAELTAKQPEGVTQVERTEDGWRVGIEIVEDRRIPSSADVLATYETTIDADGELLSYRRVRRYARGRGNTEEP